MTHDRRNLSAFPSRASWDPGLCDRAAHVLIRVSVSHHVVMSVADVTWFSCWADRTVARLAIYQRESQASHVT
jgi:hypothetical protein